MKKLLAALFVGLTSLPAFAGVDVSGYITSVHLKDGVLNFSFSNRAADAYCKVGWAGLSFYVPTDHKDYPYYYGLITSANSKKQQIRLPNISAFNGSTACDITKTGYGIIVYTPS
jgi:hypothetical protein